jgi:hypothetical protein
MTIRIGVIAEDDCDIDVIKELIPKITPGKNFVVRKFVGHGCGKVRGKCRQWAQNLKEQNCSILILLHDLDDKVLRELQDNLFQTLNPCPIRKYVIVIPVKEIEAWLLSDEEAIRVAMNIRATISRIPNPETIMDPKKHLQHLVEIRSGKTKHYLNTVHNKKIAAELRVERLKRCESFLPLESFLLAHIC